MKGKLSRFDKIVIGGALWGGGILLFAVILEPTPENYTLAVSILLSGIYTWILFLTRRIWLKGLSKTPVINAVLLGSINAIVIETLFLFVEKAFGASGVAAHPNLLVDLLMTMPWYIGMVWIFVRVQKKEKFSWSGVLLLGAIYELGADGFVGGVILPAVMGNPTNIIQFLVFSALAAFWQFIPVYSSMVLPASWILENMPANTEKPRWQRGLLPLLWLIPFTIYLIVFLLFMGFVGS